jgi:hypothetical protein
LQKIYKNAIFRECWKVPQRGTIDIDNRYIYMLCRCKQLRQCRPCCIHWHIYIYIYISIAIAIALSMLMLYTASTCCIQIDIAYFTYFTYLLPIAIAMSMSMMYTASTCCIQIDIALYILTLLTYLLYYSIDIDKVK